MSAVHSFVPAYMPIQSREVQSWDGSTWYYPVGSGQDGSYQLQNYGAMWTPTDQRWNSQGYVHYWPYTPQSLPSFDASAGQSRLQPPPVQPQAPQPVQPVHAVQPAPQVQPIQPGPSGQPMQSVQPLGPVQPVQSVYSVPQQMLPHQNMVPLNYAPLYVAPPPAPHPSHYYTFNDGQVVCGPQQPLAQGNPQLNQGVCAQVEPVLEYELAKMSNFLARMAYGIMSNRAAIWSQSQQDSFQKFVYMTLTSTRLSKSTIILALVYLSKRWSLDDLPAESDVHSYYVLFIVSLVLANKIHDDNTFTNASWCQATGISSTEITQTEMQWLSKISWSLQPANFESQGWHKWHECWMVFSGQQQPEQHLLTPSVSPQVQNKMSSNVFTPADNSWSVNVPTAAVAAF